MNQPIYLARASLKLLLGASMVMSLQSALLRGQGVVTEPVTTEFNPNATVETVPEGLRIKWKGGGTVKQATGVNSFGPVNPNNIESTFTIPTTDQRKFLKIIPDLDTINPTPIDVLPTANPVVPVSEATLRKGVTPDTFLIEAKPKPGVLSATDRVFTQLVGDDLIIFRDDGTAGDRTAGDGTFTGPIDSAGVESEVAIFNQAVSTFTKDNPNVSTAPVFNGRQKTGTAAIRPFNINAVNQGIPQVFISPNGGAPSPVTPPAPGTSSSNLQAKSLMVTDLSVVEDPTRTFDPCTGVGTPGGTWTFAHLMRQMANTPATGITPEDFTMRWIRHWQFDQTTNFDGVPKRLDVKTQIVDPWLALSGGTTLDLDRAPFRLLAIVNRVDLRLETGGYGGPTPKPDPCNPICEAGEARFIFCATTPRGPGSGGGYGGTGGTAGGTTGNNQSCSLPFLVIFEYCVPRHGCEAIQAWAKDWWNLQFIPFGPAYNAALETLTQQFVMANADPARGPNFSALNQLRTNEIMDHIAPSAPSSPRWDMREFRIFPNGSDAGHLRQVTVNQTPDRDLNQGALLANYLAANGPAILANTHSVPLSWTGQPFLGASAPMDNVLPILTPAPNYHWNATGTPGPVRFNFSLNACNGCHAGDTGTRFTHVDCREPGQTAPLSDFLTGLNMPKLDPADGSTPHSFADLQRREADLFTLVHKPCFMRAFTTPVLATH